MDILKMNESVGSVVEEIISGVSYLMNKNKIEVFQGTACIKDKSTVEVKSEEKVISLTTNKKLLLLLALNRPPCREFLLMRKELVHLHP